ncbi:Hypothetical protein POVN_LOCUS479 [uncultured virus]|nr:Hypothetical protein POVN_LOCUS479 [uncultured virus]
MPEAAAFQAGFNLKQGMVLAGYRLDAISVGHNAITRFHDYAYPTTMQWTWSEAKAPNEEALNAFFYAFANHVSGVRIIYSDAGRAYKCVFQYPFDTHGTETHGADFKQVKLSYKGFGRFIGKAEAARIASGQQEWEPTGKA